MPSPDPGRSRRARIVATLGPASRAPDTLRTLLRAGVDVWRLNCSHATGDAIRADVAAVREAAAATGRHPAVLLDLQGPKIRTGPGSVALGPGDLLRIGMDPDLVGSGHTVGTTWPRLSGEVRAGERVLFADGALDGVIEQVAPAWVDVRIRHGGTLGSHKGINLPDSDLQVPALTEKDLADLAAGVAAGVDWVALSFVRSARDVHDLRAALARLGAPDLPVVAKIEKPQAVAAIDEILPLVEAIMVARGDLGVEIDFEQVPIVQKHLIASANRAGVLVITATQMLDSMERNARPTRAEATDVANAVLDGTDAVMLSGETATGAHALEAVMVMDRIVRAAEGSLYARPPDLAEIDALARPDAVVARAACYAVRAPQRPLVVFTWSGRAALLASKSRPPGLLFALTPDPRVRDRLALVWGVTAALVPAIDDSDALVAAGEQVLVGEGHLPPGTEVIVLAGRTPFRGATHVMKLEVVDGR